MALTSMTLMVTSAVSARKRGCKSRGSSGRVPRIWSRNANANCSPYFHKILLRTHQNTPFQGKSLFYFSGEGLFPFREGLSPSLIPLSADSILCLQPSLLDPPLCPRIPAMQIYAYVRIIYTRIGKLTWPVTVVLKP